MKRICKALLIIFSVLFFLQQASVFSAPVENAELLHSEKYFETVHKFLNSAKESIFVVMYSFTYYPSYPNSPSNILLQDLIEAKQRGVDITVLLDVSKDSGKETIIEENKKTGKILSENGVKVYYDTVETLTHAKTIVIDSRYTIIGSHNWTHHGLTKNIETSVLVNSPDLAKEAEKYIMSIINIKKDTQEK